MHEEGFVDAVAFDAVGGEVAAAGEVLVGHADGGGEAAEEKAAGFEDSPEAVEHGVEVGVVAGEVEDGAAVDDVEEASGKERDSRGSTRKLSAGSRGRGRRRGRGSARRLGVLIVAKIS